MYIFSKIYNYILAKLAHYHISRQLNLSIIKGVTYDKGSALSRMSDDWEKMSDFSKAYSKMWEDMEKANYAKRKNSNNKSYIYLTSPWKIHHVCWSAFHCASNLDGDFVDIGTGAGVTIRAARYYLLENGIIPPKCFCFDRWDDRDATQHLTQNEIDDGICPSTYINDFSQVKEIFKNHKNCEYFQGLLPYTLDDAVIKKISFIYSDLNAAIPEIMTIKRLWDKVVSGGIIMIDDYGMFTETRNQWNEFAVQKGVKISSLAEGPGLLIKP